MSLWCAEQLVVTVTGPSGRSVVSLTQPFARVGSHPQADVVIDDPDVATRSLYLHATDQGVFCLFLDVHAKDVAASDIAARGIWLLPDQEIAVGNHRLQASLLTADADDPLPAHNLATWGSAPRPLPVMNVYCGDLLKDKRRFRAVLNPIGRRPQCGLQLKGKRVSSFHCVLFWHEQQLWCVDLNSSNGTQLNGQPIVCGQVSIGDRLEVGEFGLVFERLSYGRSAQAKSSPAAHSPRESRAPAGPTLPVPEPPKLQETTHVGNQAVAPLADEIARLSAERQAMQDRWEQASQQLQIEVGRLHDEAACLAAEREALDQSRGQWHEERAELTRQLAERSNQLARLQDELAHTTAMLQQKLAEVENRLAGQSSPAIPDAGSPAAPDELVLESLAPAALVAGLESQSASELSSPIEPEVVWNYLLSNPAADVEMPADPQEELRSRLQAQWQAEWHEVNQQLSAKIEQLRSEAAQLAAERQALAESRQAWQTERQELAQSLAARQLELDRQQAELAATKSSQAERLAAAEQPLQPVMFKPTAAELPAAELPAAEANMFLPNSADEIQVDSAVDSQCASTTNIAVAPLVHAPREDLSGHSSREVSVPGNEIADRDELTVFVSGRLVSRENEKQRSLLVWWITGGVAVAAILAVVVTAVVWLLQGTKG